HHAIPPPSRLRVEALEGAKLSDQLVKIRRVLLGRWGAAKGSLEAREVPRHRKPRWWRALTESFAVTTVRSGELAAAPPILKCLLGDTPERASYFRDALGGDVPRPPVRERWPELFA